MMFAVRIVAKLMSRSDLGDASISGWRNLLAPSDDAEDSDDDDVGIKDCDRARSRRLGVDSSEPLR